MNVHDYSKLTDEAYELCQNIYFKRMGADHKVAYSYSNVSVMECADEKLNRISDKANKRYERRYDAWITARRAQNV